MNEQNNVPETTLPVDAEVVDTAPVAHEVAVEVVEAEVGGNGPTRPE
jgi:hypothetical protein